MLGVIAAALMQTTAPLVGAPMPKWTPGTVDIHQISTGRGNAALFVLPDGTTLLVDAGAAADGIAGTAPHPDASQAPGEWIARYVKRHLPDPTAALDYALITHFHADHYGQWTPQSPMATHGAFWLTGITAVGDAGGFRSLIDRGWPDYRHPLPITDSTMANYRRFVASMQARGMTVERF